MFDEDDAGPTVEIPDESDASPELRRAFWVIVLVLDVGLAATALGLLMLYFDARPALAPWILALGIVFLGSAYHRYRRARERLF